MARDGAAAWGVGSIACGAGAGGGGSAAAASAASAAVVIDDGSTPNPTNHIVTANIYAGVSVSLTQVLAKVAKVAGVRHVRRR